MSLDPTRVPSPAPSRSSRSGPVAATTARTPGKPPTTPAAHTPSTTTTATRVRGRSLTSPPAGSAADTADATTTCTPGEPPPTPAAHTPSTTTTATRVRGRSLTGPPAGSAADTAGATTGATATGALDLDALVEATPASRDRVVDLLRALSIGVVVLWHWSLSVTHWRDDGSLTMPNPVGEVPGLWAATWVLQVMPVFFFVGGYANLAGWQAVTRDGHGARRFLRSRMRRLLAPLVPWLGCWAVVDLALRAGGGRSVTDWGMVVFVPLWFLAVYAGVVLAVPVTARLHRAWRGRVLAALAAGAVGADVVRLGLERGGPLPGLVGSACVWLFCHQLGYFWRDGTLVAGGRVRAHAVAAAGLAGLVALTALGPYSSSMVAVRGEETSNMFPTTACIVALATFQLGLALRFRPQLDRWLQRRGPWRATVAANGVAMPVFCWHMTALVVFIGLYEWAGFRLADQPTATWWLTRPLWVVGPGLVLAAVVTVVTRRSPAGNHPSPPARAR